jgi:deoxycytidine triphosphate deaminase
MILTGHEIEREWLNGRIVIEPFVAEQLNPNSYNFRLGGTLRIYNTNLLDVRQANACEEASIPPEGFVLEPGRLYLAHTIEVLGSDHYAPTFAARSSIARLGVFINLSASLGDIGYVGQWTLQLYAANRVRVYAGINIGQMMWWRPAGRIELYDGKYQGAAGPRSSDIHVDFHKQFARQRLPGLRTSVDAAEVGHKFAALAASCREYRVPDAFCLPAREFEAALDPDLQQDLARTFADLQATIGAFFTETVARIREIADRIRLPEGLRTLVASRLADLFDDWEDRDFAVRSSGVDEDTDGSSLAGVYESVLRVRGIDGVAAAIELCWRSWYAAPAVAARARQGDLGWQPRLGVIVQAQIRPRLAGVAFSVPAVAEEAAPGGAAAEQPCGVVIEYVEGLADRLVAGLEVPARVTSGDLDAGPARRSGAGALAHRPGLTAVAALTRSLRAARGHEVDVEWAVDDDGLHLIQVRPNTARDDPGEHSDAPALQLLRLYREEVPPGFGLGEVAEIYAWYAAKRGPAYRLAAGQGVATGPGWVLRVNLRGLRDPGTVARLDEALAEGFSGECVIDVGETLRQIVVPKASVAARLAQILGAAAQGTGIHVVIVRDFIRGELGLITRLAGSGLVVEYAPEGLMALNRGTAGAAAITVADRSRLADEPGSVTLPPGNVTLPPGDAGPALLAPALLPHLAELARFTDAMSSQVGEVTLEWVLAGDRVYFVDYSVLGADRLTTGPAGAVLVSRGTARGMLLRLADDELLARLSIGPAVSIDKATDISVHDGFARILEKVTSLPEPPVIQVSRPYAVLSALIGHVAGFVFDQGSMLGHLPILLREAGVPAVIAADFAAAGEVVISDGTVTAVR